MATKSRRMQSVFESPEDSERRLNMRLATIIDISLVDVPGIPVTVIFTAGCNFDCPYCQNADIISLISGEVLPLDEIVERARCHLTEGYCITGGEPTIHSDLPDLLKALRSEGTKHINLNTQGSVPQVLSRCLPYLDSVWFDIKSSPENYSAISRTKESPWKRVEESINILLNSEVAFWPRTTYVGNLMNADDILRIVTILDEMGFEGDYTVQNYVESDGIRPEESKNLSKPDEKDIEDLRDKTPDSISLRIVWR